MATRTAELDIRTQTASETYDCDAECGEVIPEETAYVRVATLREPRGRFDGGALYRNGVEKFHPACWEGMTDGAQ